VTRQGWLPLRTGGVGSNRLLIGRPPSPRHDHHLGSASPIVDHHGGHRHQHERSTASRRQDDLA
jgi:hypothetical protein